LITASLLLREPAAIRHREQLEAVWNISSIQPQRGRCILNFYGPPGTGKTRAALGVALQLAKPLYQVDYSAVISKYLGDTLTDEFKCAQFLDGLPEVQFWVRNLSRKASSFRLQTSTDWFYPDFICQLADGRVLVVEFKGEHLWTEAEEKRAVGAVWESRSSGRCLFIMPKGSDLEAIKSKIKKTN